MTDEQMKKVRRTFREAWRAVVRARDAASATVLYDRALSSDEVAHNHDVRRSADDAYGAVHRHGCALLTAIRDDGAVVDDFIFGEEVPE